MKDCRADNVDRTPADYLAYQAGWTTLILKWEQDEQKGLEVKTPTESIKWYQLGALHHIPENQYTCIIEL